jgi:hypothetical protein
MTAPAQLICDYVSLFNDVAYHLFGLRPVTADVLVTASTNQTFDINRAISKGLQFVYAAHRWSFLRPLVSITTYAPYETGTVTVDAAGTVLGVGTTFPSYSASAGGWLTIASVGSYAVASYTGATGLTLTGFPSGAAFTTGATYSLTFDSYPMPTGVDSLESDLTYPRGSTWPTDPLKKVSEIEIRRALSRDISPNRPAYYALTTNTFDPTAGSSRYVTLYPVPDDSYILQAIGTLRPTMIDATNRYPIGVEVLAPCIIESVLAAAEREIQGRDALHPDAVHNRALSPLLAMAIQRDKEQSSPDSVGVDCGDGVSSSNGRSGGGDSIYFDNVAGITGYL